MPSALIAECHLNETQPVMVHMITISCVCFLTKVHVEQEHYFSHPEPNFPTVAKLMIV